MAWQSPADNGFGWLVLTADNLDNRFFLDMAEAVAAADILLQGSKYVAPRRRGRPPKQKNESADLVLSTDDGVDGPRTRGRKKKNETAAGHPRGFAWLSTLHETTYTHTQHRKDAGTKPMHLARTALQKCISKVQLSKKLKMK